MTRRTQADRLTLDFDGARVGALEASGYLHESALAGTVFAKQRHHLAPGQREIDVLQGRQRAVALRDAAHSQNDISGRHRSMFRLAERTTAGRSPRSRCSKAQ